ncbi:MAG: hypothetical protein GY810_30365 [Aureispira sp.]|nr:hypothetical protein [Aureispira sp.]
MKLLKRVLIWASAIGGLGLWYSYAAANGHNTSFWYASTFMFITLYAIWIGWMKSANNSKRIEMGCHSSCNNYSHYRSLQVTSNSYSHINL